MCISTEKRTRGRKPLAAPTNIREGVSAGARTGFRKALHFLPLACRESQGESGENNGAREMLRGGLVLADLIARRSEKIRVGKDGAGRRLRSGRSKYSRQVMAARKPNSPTTTPRRASRIRAGSAGWLAAWQTRSPIGLRDRLSTLRSPRVARHRRRHRRRSGQRGWWLPAPPGCSPAGLSSRARPRARNRVTN